MTGENYKLIHGDCLEEMKNISDNSIDLCLTDLPYGQIDCVWDTKINLAAVWDELNRICKKNAAMLFFSTQRFAVELMNSNPKNFRYDLIWQKNNLCGHLNANKMPLRNHEIILVFYNKLPTYNPQKWHYVSRKHNKRRSNASNVYGKQHGEGVIWDGSDGMRFPTSVLRFNAESERFNTKTAGTMHPTQKPVELLRYLIKTYTQENETVLDFTAGSFSTGVACILENRKFIGIEKDKGWFDIGVKRMREAEKLTIK